MTDMVGNMSNFSGPLQRLGVCVIESGVWRLGLSEPVPERMLRALQSTDQVPRTKKAHFRQTGSCMPINGTGIDSVCDGQTIMDAHERSDRWRNARGNRQCQTRILCHCRPPEMSIHRAAEGLRKKMPCVQPHPLSS